MLRTLSKKGLNLEEYFRAIDVDRRGLVHRKQFFSTLKRLGLPFSSKELQDITQHYSQESENPDFVEFAQFLKDSRVAVNKKSSSAAGNSSPSTAKSFNLLESQLGSFSRTLHEVKRLLLETIKSLGKHPDEIYRQFARWDTQGTGTVTATQFLRVLARLHIDLSDQDQDFLVELLDTNAMGRIDFESLLAFCFASLDTDLLPSPAQGSHGDKLLVFDENAGETLSAVSLENTSLDLRSTGSGLTGAASKRPHTASQSRPYGGERERERDAELDGFLGGKSSSLILPSPTPLHQRNRPLTASARVSSNASHTSNHSRGGGAAENNKSNAAATTSRAAPSSSAAKKTMSSASGPAALDELMEVEELPDDVIHGEEQFLSRALPEQGQGQVAESIPSAFGLLGDRMVHDRTLDPRGLSLSSFEPLEESKNGGTAESLEPADHLVLLANQILTTLRDIILARYRRGRSLADLYDHFDQERKGFFDARDFRRTTADLRIETSERVASIAIAQLAIDGVDKVCFGEFKVFALDSDHALLAQNVQEQLAGILEKQGRGFAQFLQGIFWAEEEALMSDSRSLGQSQASMKEKERDRQQGLICKSAFVNALKRIGLSLTSSEIGRIVDRFDLYGAEQCSVPRFLHMVQRSEAWRHAEHVLRLQDLAVEEAALLRQQQRHSGAAETALSDELISMCEYLGIRVLSEKDMIWIAADALKAPLPVNWTAERDALGRTFFFNHLTNQSRWEHPLDPHFRNLRDKYRQSAATDRPAMNAHTHSNGDDMPRSRGVVLPANKPPQLDSQFVSQPLPSSRPAVALTKTARPQSARPELTLYHHPASSAIANGPSAAAKATRPVSAGPVAAHSSVAANPSPAQLLNTLMSNADAGVASQAKPAYNYFTPAASNQFLKEKQVTLSAKNNKDLLAHTRTTIEQVYHTPTGNFSRPPTAQTARSKSASHTRPISASAAGRSAVDRALSIGKTAQLVMQERERQERERDGKARRNSENRQQKLQEMLEGNIVEKLDHAMHSSRRTGFA